jgi:hypothetical protein
MKKYLKTGDKVYCDGAYLLWNNEKKSWEFDQVEDSTYFEGEAVEFDENCMPYIEEEK